MALFVGSTSGNRFEEVLPADGLYTIRVYLMRSAARRNETASYTLDVGISGRGKAATVAKAKPVSDAIFDSTLELHGIRFHVTGTNEGSINILQINPAGLYIHNSPIMRTIAGTVTGAELADLNVDGSSETYVYLQGQA